MAVVENDGVTVAQQADGVLVTATAPGGVAPSGTALKISAQAPAMDPLEAQIASGGPVRLSLGSGEQPRTPIRLQFDVSARPDLADLASDTVLPVVRVLADGDPASTDLLAVDWDASTKTATATTTHLSVFELIFANVGQALNNATKAFQTPQKPADTPCRESSETTIGDTTYKLVAARPGPVSACLTDTGEGIGIDFTNDTTQYYAATSSPEGAFSNPPPPQLPSTEQLAVWLRGGINGRAGLLTPKNSGQLILPADTTEASIRLDADPVALQLKTILTGIAMLGVSGEELLAVFSGAKSAWDCVATGFNKPGASAEAFLNALSDMAACGLAGAETGWGATDTHRVLHRMSVAVSLFTALPQQLVANVAGAIGEVTGDNHLTFTLTSQGPPETSAATDNGALVPLIIKSRGSPGDSGQELGPNHFQLGPILTDDSGRRYVSLSMRWKTINGKSIARRCNELSKILDSAGGIVLERKQRLSSCRTGGRWGFNITTPGTYTYVLEVTDRDTGASFRAEQQFVVDP